MNIKLGAINIIMETQRPRYTLPDDVPPPPNMTREEFDAWSRRVCGYQASLIPDNEIMKTPHGLIVNAATWQRLRDALQSTNG